MADLVTNSSINFERVTQSELEKVRKLHDEHSQDINHENKTIDSEDTELNYHKQLLNLDELLQQQFGKEIEEKNNKLLEQFNDGKISFNRFNERKMTIDKWLNHSGKNPKKAFTLAVAYVGDEEQTKQKLDELGFQYEVKQLKGEDGKIHNHFHLTDPTQRKQWQKIWADTFVKYAQVVNKQNAGIKIFDVTIHLDEASPHAHFKILNCGHTETGKSSYNLTQSLSDFNKSLSRKREYNKVTKKSPRKRLNGKLTLKTTREILDGFGVRVFNWALKQNGFNRSFKFEHKGDKAKLTNQMTPSEYKEYQSNLKDVQSSYKTLTGREAKNEDNTLKSPLELSRGIKRASKEIEQQKKQNEAQQAELVENEQKLKQQAEINQFNVNVQRLFYERLNQRRLLRLRQREKQQKNEIEGAKNQLIDTLIENDPTHLVDQRLLKKNELPQQVKTTIGRQQHKRQTIKYLADSVKKSLDKVAKQLLDKVVNPFVNDLMGLSGNHNQDEIAKAQRLGSCELVINSIKPTKHPTSAKYEKELMNDPVMKVRKALVMASDNQIKQAKQHVLDSSQYVLNSSKSKDNGPDL